MEALTDTVLDWGVAHAALGGNPKCGDCHVVQPFPKGALVAVLDGIGHGDEAHRAAECASEILVAHAEDNILALLKRCHETLRGTRGAVMSLASFNGAKGVMTWAGVGNVEGLLLRADHGSPLRKSLLLRGGVLGHQLPPLAAAAIPVTAGDTLIFATDGIRHGFNAAPHLKNPPQKIASQILSEDSKGNDDALVLVVRYMGSERKSRS
ncbi:MAG TPA: SpoIIE family protein phosphatase [Candidatus Binatia bacterium]